MVPSCTDGFKKKAWFEEYNGVSGVIHYFLLRECGVPENLSLVKGSWLHICAVVFYSDFCLNGFSKLHMSFVCL